MRNAYGEIARDVAARYEKKDCVEFLKRAGKFEISSLHCLVHIEYVSIFLSVAFLHCHFYLFHVFRGNCIFAKGNKSY